MSFWQLIYAGLRFHWRMHVAVALGCLTATAVLCGALLVGDSVRGSLRDMALDRLGNVEEALVAPRFFRMELARELSRSPDFAANWGAAVPVIAVPGSLENANGDPPPRAGGVDVYGVSADFWQCGKGDPPAHPTREQIVLNRPAADKLNVAVGGEVLLRIGQQSQIPPDSPLGRKTETTRSRRLRVSAILPAGGLGGFSLRPSQLPPRSAFVDAAILQAALEEPDKANAIFVTSRAAATESRTAPSAHEALARSLHPTLADCGLSLTQSPRDYYQLTTDRMLLDPAVEAAAMKAFADDKPQPVFTYLANYILAGADDAGKIPYSTVSAIDFDPDSAVGRFVDANGKPYGPLKDGAIVLNRWAVDDLAEQGVRLKDGDAVRLVFFEPESTHGQVREQTKEFQFRGVVELTGAAADPDLTPELKGVTDEASINNWQPPFPYDRTRVRATPPNDKDDRYWKDHKATPKAFISLKAGRALWASRFGQTTSIRIPAREGLTREYLLSKLQFDPKALGLEFQPVRQLAVSASAGTTSFSALFLGFSFFLIAAAVMLVTLLFRLGIERRAKEIGLLAAVGWPGRRVRGWLLGEGLCVAAMGSLIGVAAGIGYAALMLTGLRTWWLDAVSTPFLHLHVEFASLAISLLAGVILSGGAIALALRRVRRGSVRSLLAGQVDAEARVIVRKRGIGRYVGWGLCGAAVVLGLIASQLGGEAQAGAFFTAGALVLAAQLAYIRARWRSGDNVLLSTGSWPLAQMALRNGARHPGRGTLTIGLMAAATFLIVAVGAFRLAPPPVGPEKNAGHGGFALFATSDQPIYHDLNTAAGRTAAGLPTKQSAALGEAKVFPLRVQSGDDASCLNLYQPRQPRVVGVTEDFIKRGGFVFDDSAAATDDERKNPWRLLVPQPNKRSSESTVPVVLDQNTALYSLHFGSAVSSPLGREFTLTDERGQPLRVRVAGLLKDSIFQGDVLMSEGDLVQHFPSVSGYRMFLVDLPDSTGTSATAFSEAAGRVGSALEGGLGEYGFDAQRTGDRLAAFMAVQNTYLSTFQSLGGLGLLLGTLGLAAVQLRNVVERRGELALMRAVGFRPSRLAQLVLFENATLLFGGLGAGLISAAVAVWPHVFGGAARLPWGTLAATLALVLVCGVCASLFVVRAVLRAPVVAALREE